MRWIAYVDMDAYYVSCELRERPELIGRPVIVGRSPKLGPSRGVVLSASYEARSKGVRSAQPVQEADRRCPEAFWISPDFPKYGEIAEEVRNILRTFSTQVVPESIDEAAVGIEAPDALSARTIATSIQERLRSELRLPSSVGVAASRAIAKIASDRAKPAGVVVVPPEEAEEFLAPLPVRAIPGIGPKTEASLHAAGIETIGDLAEADHGSLRQALGSYADDLVRLARGVPPEESFETREPRSRSSDQTFDEDVRDWERLARAIQELARGLAGSLEQERLRYQRTSVAFRWADFERSQRSRTLPHILEAGQGLEEQAVRLGHELWEEERAHRARAVRTVSVRTERLSPASARQKRLDAFSGSPSTEG